MEPGTLPESLKTLASALELKNNTFFFEKLKNITWGFGVKKEFNQIENYYSKLWAKGVAERKLKVTASQLISEELKLELWFTMYKYLRGVGTRGERFKLQHYYDFRGRIYCKSPLSIINNKWLRSVYTYTGGSNVEITEELRGSTKNTKSYKKIQAQFCKLETGKFRTVKCDYMKQIIIWCLVELAKLFKTKLLDNGKITLDNFVDGGLELYSLYKENKTPKLDSLDLDEVLEFQKVCYILDDIILEMPVQNYFICKDSTASVLQHLFKFLGIKDGAALVMCNINSGTTWFDPYTAIVSDFFKTNNVQKTNEKYFTRKTLKKVIMTFHYSVSFRQAFKYFLEANSMIYKVDVVLDLEADFRKFFNYLSENHETNLFYKHPSGILMENPRDVEYFDGTQIKFNYYTHSIVRSEVKSKSLGIRKTYNTMQINSEKIDKTKTRRAFRANLIHSHDSSYLRKLLINLTMLTVHDMFAIPITQVCIAIDRANESFRHELITENP